MTECQGRLLQIDQEEVGRSGKREMPHQAQGLGRHHGSYVWRTTQLQCQSLTSMLAVPRL